MTCRLPPSFTTEGETLVVSSLGRVEGGQQAKAVLPNPNYS